MRSAAFVLLSLTSVLAFASKPSAPPAPPAPPAVQGVVADPTGAIVPNAEVDLVDSTGAVTCSGHSGDDGSFQLSAPHTGIYTLVVSWSRASKRYTNPVVIPAAVPAAAVAAAHTLAAPLHIILPIAAVATNVRVTADSSEDLTAPEDNHDSSVMTSDD